MKKEDILSRAQVTVRLNALINKMKTSTDTLERCSYLFTQDEINQLETAADSIFEVSNSMSLQELDTRSDIKYGRN